MSNFLGSEVLAKSDFFGSMKTPEFYFLGRFPEVIKSANFLGGMLKKSRNFLGPQELGLRSLWESLLQ